MLLSEKDIEKLADLAKLELSKDELERFSKELSSIIDFVGQLSEVGTDEVEAGRQIMGLESIFRSDEEQNLVKEKGQDLIKDSPKTKDSFIVVPRVIKAGE